MNQQEFDQWCKSLFIAFPSILEKLQKSGDPQATRQTWFKALCSFDSRAAMWCVEAWRSGSLEPPAAYEWDRAHLIARSCIAMRIDRERKSRETQEITKPYKQLPSTPYTDSRMAAAFTALRPLHAKMTSGELTPGEYAVIERDELAKI